MVSILDHLLIFTNVLEKVVATAVEQRALLVGIMATH